MPVVLVYGVGYCEKAHDLVNLMPIGDEFPLDGTRDCPRYNVQKLRSN